MNELNELLKEFREKCREVYEKKLADKNFPHPHNLPVSLLGCIDMGRLETANTKTLAYLLDGNERHGLGFVILEELMKKVGIDYCQSIKNCSVLAEKPFCDGKKIGRFDIIADGIMLTSSNKEERFEIVIEAKIDSTEGNGQLRKYDEVLAKDKRERISKRIFLTVEKTAPSEKNWNNILWSDIVDVIWTAINKDELCKAYGYQFARYYISSIYSNIYSVTDKDADIYNVVSDADVVFENVDILDKNAFNFDLYRQFPNTIDFIYYNFSQEDSSFDRSYNQIDREIREFLVQIRDELNLGVEGQNYQFYKHTDYWNVGFSLKNYEVNFGISFRNFYNKAHRENVYCIPYIYCWGHNWNDKKLLIKSNMSSEDIYFEDCHNIALAKIDVPDLSDKTRSVILEKVQNLYDEFKKLMEDNEYFFRPSNER